MYFTFWRGRPRPDVGVTLSKPMRECLIWRERPPPSLPLPSPFIPLSFSATAWQPLSYSNISASTRARANSDLIATQYHVSSPSKKRKQFCTRCPWKFQFSSILVRGVPQWSSTLTSTTLSPTSNSNPIASYPFSFFFFFLPGALIKRLRWQILSSLLGNA